MNESGVGALRAAAKAEAEGDRWRILSDAQKTARTIRERAKVEAEALRARIISDASKEVDQIHRSAIAEGQSEATAHRLQKREELLSEVFGLAEERLQDAAKLEGWTEITEALVKDAVEHLPGVASVLVRADPQTRGMFDEDALTRLAEATEVEIAFGDDLSERIGVVVESSDGRFRYDNTLQTRLDRRRLTLRSRIYDILTEERDA
ncbi:MAG: V-type ATP synthase subunit E family protein [Anaerolineae bacterium]